MDPELEVQGQKVIIDSLKLYVVNNLVATANLSSTSLSVIFIFCARSFLPGALYNENQAQVIGVRLLESIYDTDF